MSETVERWGVVYWPPHGQPVTDAYFGTKDEAVAEARRRVPHYEGMFTVVGPEPALVGLDTPPGKI